MYIEGIYLSTEVDNTFDNMMSSIADYKGSVKTDSPKQFLAKLAQAVERSKVIIALGKLGGKNGLINVLSKGLSLPMAAVDWKAMGIAPIIDTLLPKGAVPLLDDDDRLVGMILESGSQSIIALSNDAEKRTQVLELYIEPYIGAKSLESDDLYDAEPDEASDAGYFADNAPVGEDNEDETEGNVLRKTAEGQIGADEEIDTFADGLDPIDTVPADADQSDGYESENRHADAADIDALTDIEPTDIDTVDVEPTDEYESADGDYYPPSDQYFDPSDYDSLDETDRYFNEKASGDRVGFIEEEDFVLEDEPKKAKKPKMAKKDKRFLLAAIAFLLVAAIIGGYFGYTAYYLPEKCREDYATLRNYKDDMGEGKLPEDVELAQYGRLYELNNDMIGWLTIEGTNIDYPVVSSADKGDDYYQKHTFSGTSGNYGTPYFADQYGLINHPRNLAIFGNNTEDGYMLSDLENYLDLGYYKKHPVITMNSILYDYSWKIVSVMTMDKSLTTAAVDYTYSYAEETAIDEDYINALSRYSRINCADTADTSDHLLTLITPYSGDRNTNIVITARRVRENESTETDTSGASYNTQSKKSSF